MKFKNVIIKHINKGIINNVEIILGQDGLNKFKIYLDYGHKIVALVINNNDSYNYKKYVIINKFYALKYSYLFIKANIPINIDNWNFVYGVKNNNANDYNEFHISFKTPIKIKEYNNLIYILGIKDNEITYYLRR